MRLDDLLPVTRAVLSRLLNAGSAARTARRPAFAVPPLQAHPGQCCLTQSSWTGTCGRLARRSGPAAPRHTTAPSPSTTDRPPWRPRAGRGAAEAVADAVCRRCRGCAGTCLRAWVHDGSSSASVPAFFPMTREPSPTSKGEPALASSRERERELSSCQVIVPQASSGMRAPADLSAALDACSETRLARMAGPRVRFNVRLHM